MMVRAQTGELSGVRQGYDRWAASYDHDGNPLIALEEPHVRAALGDVKGLDVLELGCGTGRHTAWLHEAGANVTALDFSEGMLQTARSKLAGEGVRWVTHDLHQPLPFAHQSFDLVLSALVLEHLRDLPAFFEETSRVLRHGGRAVVSAMHPVMFLRESRARFTDPSSNETFEPGSRSYQLGEVVLAVLAAGLVLRGIGEHSPDANFAQQFPRSEKYLGWPMVLVLQAQRDRELHRDE